jgi:hypothetical protein
MLNFHGRWWCLFAAINLAHCSNATSEQRTSNPSASHELNQGNSSFALTDPSMAMFGMENEPAANPAPTNVPTSEYQSLVPAMGSDQSLESNYPIVVATDAPTFLDETIAIEGSQVPVVVPDETMAVEGSQVPVVVPDETMAVEGSQVPVVVPDETMAVDDSLVAMVDQIILTEAVILEGQDKQAICDQLGTRIIAVLLVLGNLEAKIKSLEETLPQGVGDTDDLQTEFDEAAASWRTYKQIYDNHVDQFPSASHATQATNVTNAATKMQKAQKALELAKKRDKIKSRLGYLAGEWFELRKFYDALKKEYDDAGCGQGNN